MSIRRITAFSIAAVIVVLTMLSVWHHSGQLAYASNPWMRKIGLASIYWVVGEAISDQWNCRGFPVRAEDSYTNLTANIEKYWRRAGLRETDLDWWLDPLEEKMNDIPPLTPEELHPKFLEEFKAECVARFVKNDNAVRQALEEKGR